MVSHDILDMFPYLLGMVLEKKLPDYHLILLSEHVVDYGPYPFRLFQYCFEIYRFDYVVIHSWSSIVEGVDNLCTIFKKKL